MNTNDKLYYSMLYAIIGDTIGFGNGDYEVNYGFDSNIYSNKDAEKISNYTTKHIFDFQVSFLELERPNFSGTNGVLCEQVELANSQSSVLREVRLGLVLGLTDII